MENIAKLKELLEFAGYKVEVSKRLDIFKVSVSTETETYTVKGDEAYVVGSILKDGLFPVQKPTNVVTQKLVDNIMESDAILTKATNGNISKMTQSRKALQNLIQDVKTLRVYFLNLGKETKEANKVNA